MAVYGDNRRLLRVRDKMDRSYADALDIEALRDPFGNGIRISQPAPVAA